MPIVLFRVDERLIHGQVVIGWGERLQPDRYLVVDDELAASPWEQELYRLGAGDATAVFTDVAEARVRLATWKEDAWRSVLLTRDLESMLRLARDGLLRGESVNLGGIHHAEGRTRVRPYLYLGPAEREAIHALEEEEGVSVS
ncbi:MAG TPA: PTS sugar transporter subunit IIB, partial [Longimicrobiales bacterium]|nr:PTS sugar transporter subunit IIB [Longimicrobiales bacterium]